MIGAFRGRNPNNASDRTTGAPTEQRLEINQQGTSNTITTVQKDNVVVDNYKIRRLTPRECFRLMDFPDTFTWPVSDSQAYKQAGNSIVVRVLEKIINNLPL
jgi:DNA (cytosine-5)-methyltransferase 1